MTLEVSTCHVELVVSNCDKFHAMWRAVRECLAKCSFNYSLAVTLTFDLDL